MCSLRSFVAKLCQKSKTFRDSTTALQAATKEVEQEQTEKTEKEDFVENARSL